METITIAPILKEACPHAALGCIQGKVQVQPSPSGLLEEIQQACDRLQRELPLAQIQEREQIANTRLAYKAMGKDPHRYRNSAEAMCRRIVQGKGLYRINNVVDCNNLISILSGYSLGTYDLANIQGPICWTVSPTGTHYQGIGKDQINVEHLPVLQDQQGPFGNPTSDCVRAMITPNAREILMCIYSFGRPQDMEPLLLQAKSLLETYCDGEDLQWGIVTE